MMGWEMTFEPMVRQATALFLLLGIGAAVTLSVAWALAGIVKTRGEY